MKTTAEQRRKYAEKFVGPGARLSGCARVMLARLEDGPMRVGEFEETAAEELIDAGLAVAAGGSRLIHVADSHCGDCVRWECSCRIRALS